MTILIAEKECVRKEFFKSQELKTNKVNDTVQTWGKKESGTTSGRSTPAPSRNIGETFTENRVAKTVTENKSANSWRTKTPEPTLKLVNVSVEKSAGSNQNIHISENAQKQMASFVSSSSSQKEEVVTMNTMSSINTNTMSSQSSHMSHMSSSSKHSGEQQANYLKHDTFSAPPPPAPERNQSYGGKCENENTCSEFKPITPKIYGHATLQPNDLHFELLWNCMEGEAKMIIEDGFIFGAADLSASARKGRRRSSRNKKVHWSKMIAMQQSSKPSSCIPTKMAPGNSGTHLDGSAVPCYLVAFEYGPELMPV